MGNESGGHEQTGENREDDGTMDVWSDIEGQEMQHGALGPFRTRKHC